MKRQLPLIICIAALFAAVMGLRYDWNQVLTGLLFVVALAASGVHFSGNK